MGIDDGGESVDGGEGTSRRYSFGSYQFCDGESAIHFLGKRIINTHIRQPRTGTSLIPRRPIWAGSRLGRCCHACGRTEHGIIAIVVVSVRILVASGGRGDGERLEVEEWRRVGIHGRTSVYRSESWSLLVAGWSLEEEEYTAWRREGVSRREEQRRRTRKQTLAPTITFLPFYHIYPEVNFDPYCLFGQFAHCRQPSVYAYIARYSP